jgi:hypothetical protein
MITINGPGTYFTTSTTFDVTVGVDGRGPHGTVNPTYQVRPGRYIVDSTGYYSFTEDEDEGEGEPVTVKQQGDTLTMTWDGDISVFVHT